MKACYINLSLTLPFVDDKNLDYAINYLTSLINAQSVTNKID